MYIMKNVIKHIVIVVISSGLLACSTSADRPDTDDADVDNRRSDCIFRSSVRGYSVLDDSNLIVEGSGRRNYHVTLRRPARGLRSTMGIGIKSSTSRACAGFSEVTFNGTMGVESISIESIRELDSDEHEDLLIRFGKKEPEIKQDPAPREVNGAEVEELDPAAERD